MIDAFQREPGISKRKIKRILEISQQELLQGKSYEKQKASVTAVVTDCEISVRTRGKHAAEAVS